jgi:hypothetical protein
MVGDPVGPGWAPTWSAEEPADRFENQIAQFVEFFDFWQKNCSKNNRFTGISTKLGYGKHKKANAWDPLIKTNRNTPNREIGPKIEFGLFFG